MSVDHSRQGDWMKKQKERGRDLEQVQTLQFGGGGGTSGPMDPSVSIKDYVDARDEAIETRLFAKLDTIPTKSTIWGAVGVIIGTMLAVLAFAGDRFDGGISAGGIVSQVKDEQAAKDKAQDAKLELIDQKLDVLIRQTATDQK